MDGVPKYLSKAFQQGSLTLYVVLHRTSCGSLQDYLLLLLFTAQAEKKQVQEKSLISIIVCRVCRHQLAFVPLSQQYKRATR